MLKQGLHIQGYVPVTLGGFPVIIRFRPPLHMLLLAACHLSDNKTNSILLIARRNKEACPRAIYTSLRLLLLGAVLDTKGEQNVALKGSGRRFKRQGRAVSRVSCVLPLHVYLVVMTDVVDRDSVRARYVCCTLVGKRHPTCLSRFIQPLDV